MQKLFITIKTSDLYVTGDEKRIKHLLLWKDLSFVSYFFGPSTDVVNIRGFFGSKVFVSSKNNVLNNI